MNIITEIISHYLNSIEIKIRMSNIRDSETRILKIENKLNSEKIYYKRLLEENLKRCEEMQKQWEEK